MTVDLKKTMSKPLINAGVNATAVSIFAGDQSSFVIGGKSYPVWMVSAAIGAASSFSTEVISNSVLPHIPGNQRYHHLESMSLHLLSGGGSTVLIGKMLNSNLNMQEAKIFFGAGVIGEVVSSHIFNNFIDQPIF